MDLIPRRGRRGVPVIGDLFDGLSNIFGSNQENNRMVLAHSQETMTRAHQEIGILLGMHHQERMVQVQAQERTAQALFQALFRAQ